MNTNISAAKHNLEEEFSLLEKELHSVGQINPKNPEDWEVSASEPLTETAEMETVAAEITDFEDRSSIEFELEERYNEVKRALAKIEAGTYGTCETCGVEIEGDRLEANPAAGTCKLHMNS